MMTPAQAELKRALAALTTAIAANGFAQLTQNDQQQVKIARAALLGTNWFSERTDG